VRARRRKVGEASRGVRARRRRGSTDYNGNDEECDALLCSAVRYSGRGAPNDELGDDVEDGLALLGGCVLRRQQDSTNLDQNSTH
jgi:hypothetical protein